MAARVAAGALLVVLSPLLALVAVVNRVVEREPALFKAERAGMHGQPFMIYKFRTMRSTATASDVITRVEDGRVTRLGRLLRSTKLDELPQLINVARGEMAFFGPRPEDPTIVSRYYTLEHMKTLAVLPGIIGAGQVLYAEQLESTLAGVSDVEDHYGTYILPIKLAAELDYLTTPGIVKNLDLLRRTVELVWNAKRDATPPTEEAFGTTNEVR